MLNSTISKVIRFHNDAYLHTRWIGVDLNTTGHAVVAADLISGKVMKLAKRIHYSGSSVTKNCTKLYHENKLWKLRRVKTRDKKEFKAALNKIARQIVGFAESACAGIKFEKLFSYRYLQHREMEDSYEFSFENGSFIALLHLVEKRALNRGIPVQYVNPANTSKRCSRCGCFGRRVRKRFECPGCGMVTHADVNAAFNIAAASSLPDKTELHRMRISRRQMRKLARREPEGVNPAGYPEVFRSREMLAGMEKGQKISGGI
jgi:putative transposase